VVCVPETGYSHILVAKFSAAWRTSQPFGHRNASAEVCTSITARANVVFSDSFNNLINTHATNNTVVHRQHTSMAPTIPRDTLARLARRTVVTAAPALASHHFERRGLTVNHTQAVTLGVICAYVVIIALLWNLPYVRWVLWPFKVSYSLSLAIW
jgi:hypothetical protein